MEANNCMIAVFNIVTYHLCIKHDYLYNCRTQWGPHPGMACDADIDNRRRHGHGLVSEVVGRTPAGLPAGLHAVRLYPRFVVIILMLDYTSMSSAFSCGYYAARKDYWTPEH